MASIALTRLREERKTWRREKPFGFWARPVTKEDGTQDLMNWEAGIPGKPGTDWANGVYKLKIIFSEDYPSKPPKCQFCPVLFHPNVYPSGTVCLSILNEEKDWKPSLSLRQTLTGIQDLLDTPNEKDPAQEAPYKLYMEDKAAYSTRVRQEAEFHTPKN